MPTRPIRCLASIVLVALGMFLNAFFPSHAQAGGIAGTVTGPDGVEPLNNIEVNAYQWDSMYGYWAWIQTASIGTDGSYTIGGLPAGTYRVEFHDSQSVHATECYDNAPNLDSATDIVVGAGATVSGKDASLGPAIPEIEVEALEGDVLIYGEAVATYGPTPSGLDSRRTFVVRNIGDLPLTDLAVTKSGPYQDLFSVGALGDTTLDPCDITLAGNGFEAVGFDGTDEFNFFGLDR